MTRGCARPTQETPSCSGRVVAMSRLQKAAVLVGVLGLAGSVLTALAGPTAAATSDGRSKPEWFRPQNHVSAAAETLAGVLSGRLRQPTPVNAGSSCRAE